MKMQFSLAIGFTLLSLNTFAQQCQSPLYVSEVQINQRKTHIPSLALFIQHYRNLKLETAVIGQIIKDSGIYSEAQFNKALVMLQGTQTRRQSDNSAKPDLAALRQKYQQLLPYARDIDKLISEVKKGTIDPYMDLSIEPATPLSLVDYVLSSKHLKYNAEHIEQLILAGTPVYSNAINLAIKPNTSETILPLLLQNFHYGNIDKALDLLLMQGLETNTAAAQEPTSAHTFNQKLALLLDHGLSATPELAKKASKELQQISPQNAQRLSAYTQNIEGEQSLLDPSDEVKTRATAYLAALDKAKQRWPYFTFAYDKGCKKVPATSHYRLDNLISEYELKQLAKKNAKDEAKAKTLFIQRGDIYYDWYRVHTTKTQPEPTLTAQQRNNLRKLHRLMLESRWKDVDDIIYSPELSKNESRVYNQVILHVGLEVQAPAHIVAGWLERGAIVDVTTLSKLIANPQYTKLIITQLKNDSLPQLTHKSPLYLAASLGNFELVKAIYSEKKLDKRYRSDEGLTALNWTLLNYQPELAKQLNLLLKRQKPSTKTQTNILMKAVGK